MTAELSERQARLVASYVKNLSYSAPEMRGELAEEFVDELLRFERTRLSAELERVLRNSSSLDWRSNLIPIVMRAQRGEL